MMRSRPLALLILAAVSLGGIAFMFVRGRDQERARVGAVALMDELILDGIVAAERTVEGQVAVAQRWKYEDSDADPQLVDFKRSGGFAASTALQELWWEVEGQISDDWTESISSAWSHQIVKVRVEASRRGNSSTISITLIALGGTYDQAYLEVLRDTIEANWTEETLRIVWSGES